CASASRCAARSHSSSMQASLKASQSSFSVPRGERDRRGNDALWILVGGGAQPSLPGTSTPNRLGGTTAFGRSRRPTGDRARPRSPAGGTLHRRSEEHTSELQSRG